MKLPLKLSNWKSVAVVLLGMFLFILGIVFDFSRGFLKETMAMLCYVFAGGILGFMSYYIFLSDDDE